MIDGETFIGIRLGPVDLEETVDSGKHRLFRLIVRGSELLGSFKHHVLKVMGKPRVVRRVILSADTGRDVSLDRGLGVVNGHVDFETVVEGTDFGLEGIAFYRLVLRAGSRCKKGGQGRHGKQYFFHLVKD